MTKLPNNCSKRCPNAAQKLPAHRLIFWKNGENQAKLFEDNNLRLLTVSSFEQRLPQNKPMQCPKPQNPKTRDRIPPSRVRLIETVKLVKLKHLIFSKNNLEKDYKIQ